MDAAPVTIAVDVMGGDHGPRVTLAASLNFLRSHARARALFVGRDDALELLSKEPAHAPLVAAVRQAQEAGRAEWVSAEDVISMDDAPATVLRSKRRSSIHIASQCVKEGRAQAMVSAGNTGALMAIARFVLRTLPGIDRPAIAAQLPNPKGNTTMLDLGANVDCTAEHLQQFAVMGSALSTALDNLASPRVGLLNIGEELIKGNETVKAASELLQARAGQGGLNFLGNVEGDDIYRGTADVVVCDGFVGNVALKTSEGLAQMMAGMIKEEFQRGWASKLSAAVALPVLNRFKQRIDHRAYNGASLVGLQGIVLKSHGSADAFGFEQALRRAYDASDHDLLGRISRLMQQM